MHTPAPNYHLVKWGDGTTWHTPTPTPQSTINAKDFQIQSSGWSGQAMICTSLSPGSLYTFTAIAFIIVFAVGYWIGRGIENAKNK